MTVADCIIAVQDAFWRRAEELLLHHTNPWELDEAMVAAGFAMGPCEAQDLVGLHRVLQRGPARSVPILPRMVAEGRMGKIGGVGYYRYPGGGGAVIDPLIEDLILEEAWFAKVTRRDLPAADLVTQMCRVVQEMAQTWQHDGMGQREAEGILAQAVHAPVFG